MSPSLMPTVERCLSRNRGEKYRFLLGPKMRRMPQLANERKSVRPPRSVCSREVRLAAKAGIVYLSAFVPPTLVSHPILSTTSLHSRFGSLLVSLDTEPDIVCGLR